MSKSKRKLKRVARLINSLDPLPEMNRVMQWGPGTHFTTYEDMMKAVPAVASALEGFTKDIQYRFTCLYIAGK